MREFKKWTSKYWENLAILVIILFIIFGALTSNALTLLMVPGGGTGAGTFTAGGILQGDGTGAIQSNIMSGDGTLSASGVLTVSADAVETITVEGKATEVIAMGKAVYISGAVGNNVQFSLADNTVAGKNYVAGVAIESKTAGQTIRVRHVGQLNNFDTSAWADGDNLYLSTAGSLINTVPTSGTTLHVAYVEYSHATLGDILLHVCGEKNIGAPASTDLYIRMGDNAGANKLGYRDYANNEVANIDSDGKITAVEFIGPLTGNSSTATALAANGANCAVGNYPLGVNASGAVESCTPIGGGGDITDVFDCSTGNCSTMTVGTSEYLTYGTGYIDANRFAGVTTVDSTEFGYLNGLTAAIVQTGSASHDGFSDFVANEHLDWTADLGATNIHAGNYTDMDTTYNGGRSITISGEIIEDINADSELYTTKAKIAFEDPVATDDFFFEELATATTFTSIYCKTLVGTVTLDVSIAGADINGVDIVCNTTGVLDSSLGGDTAGAIGEELALVITSVASDPTYLFLQVNGTYDD